MTARAKVDGKNMQYKNEQWEESGCQTELALKEWLNSIEEDEDINLKVWLAIQEKTKLVSIILKLLKDLKHI